MTRLLITSIVAIGLLLVLPGCGEGSTAGGNGAANTNPDGTAKQPKRPPGPGGSDGAPTIDENAEAPEDAPPPPTGG